MIGYVIIEWRSLHFPLINPYHSALGDRASEPSNLLPIFVISGFYEFPSRFQDAFSLG